MRSLVVLLLLTMLLHGCATPTVRDTDGQPVLQRWTGETVPPAKIDIADVAALSREGYGAEQIVARMRATGSRLGMEPAQQRELQRRGVPQSTIDALVDAEAEARRVDRLTIDADRAANRRRVEERRIYYQPYPYAHPLYGYGWHRHHGWHSGILFGW